VKERHDSWYGPELILDGIRFPRIDSDDIPAGFCDVDVKLDDNGDVFDCAMVSGHVALTVCGENRDTVRPSPAWFIYIKGPRGLFRSKPTTDS